MENERKSVKRLVEILGGHWGQIGLEKRYEHAERALYRCVQKADESADSFLARADIMWTELNSKNMKISDLQAYVTLRGSTLSSDDKKKVLVDADSTGSGELSVQRVSSAIRMLGAGFFQDVTGVKRAKQKTYDQATLLAEADDDVHDEVYAAEGDGMNEDDMVEVLMQEGDTMRRLSLTLKMLRQIWSKGMRSWLQPSTLTLKLAAVCQRKSGFEDSGQCLQVVSTRALKRAVARESFRRVTHLRESH